MSQSTAKHSTALYCTALHCTSLYFIVAITTSNFETRKEHAEKASKQASKRASEQKKKNGTKDSKKGESIHPSIHRRVEVMRRGRRAGGRGRRAGRAGQSDDSNASDDNARLLNSGAESSANEREEPANDGSSSSKDEKRVVKLRESSSRSRRNRTGAEKKHGKSLRSLRRGKRLEVNENQPELHVLGEISGGTGFPKGVCLKFIVDYGEMWRKMAGQAEGQTHVDYPIDDCEMVVWSHPVDLHFSASSVQGWPRLLMQVWSIDSHGVGELVSYGFCNVPTSPGFHRVDCRTWRPRSTDAEEIRRFYVGDNPRIAKEHFDILFGKAWAQRNALETVGSGTIHLELDIILKNFESEGVET